MSATIENQAKLDLPTAPQPTYPDVPWWSNLVTALVVAAVSVIATVVFMRSNVTLGAAGISTPSAAGLVVDTLVYMPHIILLFGVLGDMFTYDGVWSIPSLVGVLSIFLNYVFQYFWIGLDDLWKKAAAAYNRGNATEAPKTTLGGGKFSESYDGCSVQGFESLKTVYAPQTLVITATVFSYYCFDLVQNRGWVNSAAALTFFILSYIGQVAIISQTNATGGCEGGGAVPQAIRGLMEGILFGGSSYGIVKTYYPSRLPSSTVSPFPRKTAADLTPGPDGTLRDSDGYPYVVLPNGQAVPDLSSAQSRQAFAETASKNLGSGTPATACNLSANAPVDQRLAQISALASTS